MRRKLGEHGPEVSPIVLGAWAIGGWWWGGSDDQQATAAIQAALDAGINAIDTAPVYGFGHSERVVGQAIAGRRDEVVVMTKCGLDWQTDGGVFYFETEDRDGRRVAIRKHSAPEAIVAECEASLQRLGVEAIDLYQLHWPEPGREPEQVMEAMAGLLQQGKIKAIGVSNCDPEWMARALQVAPLTCHQPRWSWLARSQEQTTLAFSREHGLGAVVYSPLQQGLLTGRIKPGHRFPPGDGRARMPWFRPESIVQVQPALEAIRPLAEAHGCTLAQLVLASTIVEPGITAAIAGARSPAQARENAGAMAISLSDDERATIRAAFEAVR